MNELTVIENKNVIQIKYFGVGDANEYSDFF